MKIKYIDLRKYGAEPLMEVKVSWGIGRKTWFPVYLPELDEIVTLVDNNLNQQVSYSLVIDPIQNPDKKLKEFFFSHPRPEFEEYE